MKKRKIIIITCSIIGIIFLSIGLITLVSSLQSNKFESEKTPEQEIKEKDKLYNITRNYNKKLKEKKCYENVCVDKLSITKQDGIYCISGTIINENSKTIHDTGINLIFTTNKEKKIKKTQYINNIVSNGSIPLEMHFTEEDKELLEATDYKIELAKAEELAEIKSKIVN